MNLRMFLFISILFLSAVLAYSQEEQFLKLDKVAISNLPEDLIIPELNSVTVDQKGNIFAFAGKTHGNECFIIKFDKNLRFISRFGRDGKGPGEFSTRFTSPEHRLSIDNNGDIYVVDYNPGRRLVVFDNEGKYKKDIFLERNYLKVFGKIHQIKVVGDDTFIALQYRGELSTQAIIFTLDPSRVLVHYPFNEKRIYDNYISDYYGENCIIDTDSQYIVFGHSQIYKFQVYDRRGNLILTVEDEKRRKGSFNDREMENIIDNHFTPKTGYSQIKNAILRRLNAEKAKFNKVLSDIKQGKNVIADIKISGEKIYVLPVRKEITIRDRYLVEIYNLKGNKIREGYFRKRPDEIWKNYLFFCDRDEEDNPLIIKYILLGNN